MKAIIIGAGIAGLTAAHALRRNNVEVKLYEKASALKSIGGGILIWPHGLRYLEWIGLKDCFQPFYTKVRGCKVIGNEGNEILSADYKELYDLLGGEVLPIERSIFQKILHDQLPANLLQLNKTCSAIESNNTGITVSFSDGSKDSGDILIAADGIHSSIRKTIFPQIEISYSHTAWWGGITEQRYAPSMPTEEVYFGIGEGKVCIVWPTANNKLLWYVAVKIKKEELRTDGFTQLTEICKNWHPEINQLLHAPSEQRFHQPINTFSAPTLHQDRVVFIGDAAQTLGPILAQGASRAIEDVFVLTTSLATHHNHYAAAFKQYDSLRRDKLAHLFNLENQTAELMINDKLINPQHFQEHMQPVDLITMYQELIPIVDEASCLDLAQACKKINVAA